MSFPGKVNVFLTLPPGRGYNKTNWGAAPWMEAVPMAKIVKKSPVPLYLTAALWIVWALLGWCVLPPRREAVTIYRLSASEPQLERQVRAFVWSRESGLAGGRLILAGGEEAPETAALAERLAAQYACVEYRPCAGCRE